MTENKALIYPKECIKDAAESLNINNLSDEIATALAQDVEYRLNQVIQESIKFMRHSQREKLMVDDINHALRVQNVEPLYGFNGPNNIDFKKITHNNQELYYLNDTEVSFDTLFDAPLPSVPPEMSFTAHWLAIEGVQPVIPQNPVEKEVEDKPSPAKKPKNIPDETTEPAKLEIKSSVKHKLPKELQVYFEKIASAVVSTEESLRVTAYQSLAEDPGLAQLLPYFVNFCSQKISDSLKDFQTLSYILNMISAIMRSPFLDIQHYLHQLMPAILSCTFAKAYENESTDLHWQVRRQAAALVNRVYTDFGEIHQSVKTKLIKTIHEALLNPNKPLSSCCGALILLPMLGEQPFRESVVTNLLIIGNRLTHKLTHNNQRIVGEARYCINQIVKSLEDIVKNHEENIPKELPQPDNEQVTAKVSRGVQQVLKESAEYSKIWWYLQNPKQIDTFKV